MTCHQGRAVGPRRRRRRSPPRRAASDDTVSAGAQLHRTSTTTRPPRRCSPGARRAATSTPGQVYDVRFRHVDGFDTCIGCHDPHTTQVRFDACAGCHTGVTDVSDAHAHPDDVVGRHRLRRRRQHQRGDLRRARRPARQAAGAAIQRYGKEHGTPICYSPPATRTGSSTATATAACSPPRRWPPTRSRAGPRACCAPPTTSSWPQGSGRVRPQREVHHRAAARLDHRRERRAGRQGRHDARRCAPTSATSTAPARRPATGTEARQVDADLLACHGGEEGFRFFVQYGVGQVVPETANGLECGTCHDNPGRPHACSPSRR